MNKIRILELFAGIGACSKALEKLGIEHQIVDAVEIDKYAIASFNAIHGTNFQPQDICDWDKDIDVDLIMHGSPCQDFSLAGKQAGGDEGSGTRSSLMYETLRIVEKLKPKYVIWENVKNIISKKHKHNFDNYCNKMSELGYKNYAQVLNAKDYGIPQNRERVFTISIRKDIDKDFIFPPKQELKLRLKDMLEENVDEKYYLSERNIQYICGNAVNSKLKDVYDRSKALFNKNISYTISTKQDRRLGDSNFVIDNYNDELSVMEYLKIKNVCNGVAVLGNYSPSNHNASRIVDNNGITPTVMENYGTITATQTNDLRIRKLTPKECWRLMGFDDEDFEKASKVNSNSQLYKQAGNSIVVNVLEKIFKELIYGTSNN